MRRFIVLIAIGVLLAQRAAAADKDSSASAADIVSKIIRDEEAVEKVHSLDLKFEGKWARPAESIARHTAELKKRMPGSEVNVETDGDLAPELTEELEIAFDSKRLRKLGSEKGRYDLRIWDGKRAMIHERYDANDQEHYAFDASPHQLISEIFFTDLGWLRMGAPSLWFNSNKFTRAEMQAINGEPKDYKIVGQQKFRGRECLVLNNRQAQRRLFVGAEDHRLHGLTILFIPNNVDRLSQGEKIWGRKFASEAELTKFTRKLTAAEETAAERRFNEVMWDTFRPLAEHYLDDYREIAPGFYFPFKQGYTVYATEGAVKVDGSLDLQLVEFKANQPLDDSLFKMEFKDGVQVFDWGHDPMLEYKYDSHRSPEEFQKIVEKQEQQNEAWKKQKAEREKLVGQKAPDFPSTDWLSSEPLDWSKLKGKVVLLHFWAHWCGPCHNDLRLLETLYQKNKEELVVIGVHTPGSEDADIKKDLDEYSMQYPIMIDVPQKERPNTWGAFAGECRVNYLPFCVVVGADGKFAALGNLNEVLGPMRKSMEQLADRSELPPK